MCPNTFSALSRRIKSQRRLIWLWLTRYNRGNDTMRAASALLIMSSYDDKHAEAVK